jgi:hypothetical protein
LNNFLHTPRSNGEADLIFKPCREAFSICFIPDTQKQLASYYNFYIMTLLKFIFVSTYKLKRFENKFSSNLYFEISLEAVFVFLS